MTSCWEHFERFWFAFPYLPAYLPRPEQRAGKPNAKRSKRLITLYLAFISSVLVIQKIILHSRAGRTNFHQRTLFITPAGADREVLEGNWQFYYSYYLFMLNIARRINS